MIKSILKIINIFLVIIALILAYLIFIKKDLHLEKLNNYFHALTNYLNILNKPTTVSNTNKFIHLDNDIYYNEDYQIYSPYYGTILKVSDHEITIKCNNGYLAYFENIINVNVNIFDVVNKDDSLANFIDNFTFYLTYDGKKYSYYEISSFI